MSKTVGKCRYDSKTTEKGDSMTEETFDKLLREALMEAVWQDFRPAIEAAEHEQITYSERYLKRRERLLEDPFGYAKKMLRTPLQRLARTAAMILLVCSLLFAMALTVPEVRAAIKRVYMEWYETHIAVYVQEPLGGDVTDLSVFYVEIPAEVLPEGYRETVRMENSGIVHYENEKGETVTIDYHSAGKHHAMGINVKDTAEFTRIVGGVEYFLFETDNRDKANRIVWFDEEYNLVIGLTVPTKLSVDERLSLAQNILVVKKLK